MLFQSVILAALFCLAGASRCDAQAMPAASGPAPPAITALNQAFRAAYAEAKLRALASAGPTLIVNGNQLVLRSGPRRVEADAGSPLYDTLKTMAHIPLAIYVSLAPGGEVDGDRAKSLADLRELIVPAAASLDGLRLPADTYARQKQIVADCLSFLDGTIRKGSVDRAALRSFAHGMASPVMENVREATRLQLDALHAQVLIWRRELSAEEWSRLHVLLIGPHMARQDLVAGQYFLRLLHETAEGLRVVYAESLWEEPKAMDLLGTHLLDGSVGEAFFGDALRMHRDLLGDAASEYLPHLLPQ